MNWRTLLCSLLAVTLALLSNGNRVSAVGWYDDFNDGNAEDGNPVTWTYNELGLTPGNYDASSGDYALSAPGGPTFNDDTLVASVAQPIGTTYARTRAVIQPGSMPDEVGGNVGLVVRFDPFTFSGYAAVLDDGEQWSIVRVDFGDIIPIAGSDGSGIDAMTDVMMELEAVGSTLSLYMWRPTDPKPATPIASVDDASYTAGRSGIVYNEDDDNTTGVFRFAAAQDTPFANLACDFDNDVRCDITDIDLLAMEASSGGTNLRYDLDNNGQVNLDDVDSWRSQAGAVNLGPGRSYLEGDANLDGSVDGTDFGIWNSNKFNATGKWSQGDFNVNGSTDGSDFNIFNANKFTSADVAAVPEPTSLIWAVVGLSLTLARRWT